MVFVFLPANSVDNAIGGLAGNIPIKEEKQDPQETKKDLVHNPPVQDDLAKLTEHTRLRQLHKSPLEEAKDRRIVRRQQIKAK